MTVLQALILSAIEGLTEFLPISSTGHLILAASLLRVLQTDFVKTFEIFIQLGAIFAVVVFYFTKFIRRPRAWLPTTLAFLPTVVIGLTFYRIIKQYLIGDVRVVLAALFIGGVILLLLERFYKPRYKNLIKIEDIKPWQALIIGLCQSISVIPGVSRAAATIAGGLVLGLPRETAVEFSFLLAVPTMLAAASYDLLKSGFSFSSYQFLLLGLGFGGAFVTALLAIKVLVGFVKKHTFAPFGIYRIALALLLIPLIFEVTTPPTPTATIITKPTINLALTATQSATTSATKKGPYDSPVSRINIKVPILTYHYIGLNPNPADKLRYGLSVTPDNFEAQLTYLKDQGYTPVTLSKLYEAFAGGEIPTRPTVLTFDDGYMDFFVNAYPILKKFNYPAVSFIPTNLMNQGYYLSWDQIKEMAASGLIGFGDHSADHADLRNLTYTKMVEELKTSRDKLKSETGQNINFVCYPYGYISNTVIAAAKAVGYIGGVTTAAGYATGKSLTTPRININGYTTLNSFKEKVAGL